MGKVPSSVHANWGGSSVGEHLIQPFTQAGGPCPPSQGSTQARGSSGEEPGVQWGGQGQVTHIWGILVSPATKAEGTQPAAPAGVRPFSLCLVLLRRPLGRRWGPRGSAQHSPAHGAPAAWRGALAVGEARWVGVGAHPSLCPHPGLHPLTPTLGGRGSRAFRSRRGWQPSELRRRADAFPK